MSGIFWEGKSGKIRLSLIVGGKEAGKMRKGKQSASFIYKRRMLRGET